MPNKKVLITGVAGFIGSNLLDYLTEHTDWHITGLDNFSTGRKANIEQHLDSPRFEFIEGDSTDMKSLKPYEVVFHLAALPRIQPSFELVTEHVVANVLNGTHLIELMIKEQHFPRFVYSGSSSIYGNPEQVPTNEEEGIKCMNPYAFQKYELEVYLDLLATRFPLDYVKLRYFNPYGPRSFNPENSFNAYSSVVGIFLWKHQQGERLKVTGDGSQRRDFIHVYDVARANYAAAVHPEKLNTAINVGHGSTLSILELAKMISPDFDFIPMREGEADITFADVSKAKELMGWEPVFKIEDFVKETLKNS